MGGFAIADLIGPGAAHPGHNVQEVATSSGEIMKVSSELSGHASTLKQSLQKKVA